MTPLVQCVPNFSEGRNPVTIAAIVDAARAANGVRVADWSADGDHNRMVVTLVGAPDAVKDAAIAMAGVAVARIDLRRHQGVHPRLGAIDVLPFVPLRATTLDDCAHLAREAALEISRRYVLPAFLYEAASDSSVSLPAVRKGAFTSILPDFGPSVPHLTAGAVVVGARYPLIAYNVDLSCSDLGLAREIARKLRTVYAGRVRALGLDLPSRGIVQVSMNIIAPDAVSLIEVVAFISARAPILSGELIGALPGPTAYNLVREALKMPGMKPGQVLFENWPT